MGTINVGIGHDDDFFISESLNIKAILNSAANCSNECFYFIICHHLLDYCLFGIQDFTSEWKNGLEFAITAGFRTSSRRISLHNVKLCSMFSSFATVSKFSWKHATSKYIFSEDGFFCEFCSKSGSRSEVNFCEDFIKFFWILCKIVFEIVVSKLFNCSTNIAISKSSFGLSFKLRFRDFYGNDPIETIGYI